jgi:hypothetical protein
VKKMWNVIAVHSTPKMMSGCDVSFIQISVLAGLYSHVFHWMLVNAGATKYASATVVKLAKIPIM